MTVTASRFALDFDLSRNLVRTFRLPVPYTYWIKGEQVDDVSREIDGKRRVTLHVGDRKDVFGPTDEVEVEVRPVLLTDVIYALGYAVQMQG